MKTLNDRGLIHQVFIIKGLFGDEETARTSADVALGDRIDDEEAARAGADTTLGNRIGDEETARANADTALGDRISDEQTARTDADTALGDRIDDLQDLVSLIPKFGVSVVQNLPTEDISDTTIYLVPSDGEEGNLYTEYIHVDGNWEILGQANVQLDLVTNAQIDAIIAGE